MMVEELNVNTARKVELIDITDRVNAAISNKGVKDGFCLLFVPHTTAGITINENADPTVGVDIKEALIKMLPKDVKYRHMEGNSEAHLLSSLIGVSLPLIIKDNKLVLGTWQGIYFCEFDGPRNRKILMKIT